MASSALTASEVRSKQSQTALVPEVGPATAGRLRHSDIASCVCQRCTLGQPCDEGEPLVQPLTIRFCEQAVEIILTEVTDDLFFSSRHCHTNIEYTQIFCEPLNDAGSSMGVSAGF